jgi:hypothetical protein
MMGVWRGPQTAAGNVTTVHDLPPISAALAAQNLVTEMGGPAMSAELAKDTNQKSDDGKVTGAGTALDSCFGEIGISAVAAAARYQGSAKNPAYAPTSNSWRDRIAEAAA